MTPLEVYHAGQRGRWRQSPLTSLEALTHHKPFLVIAPHPDDETLGCGGLIALATRAELTVTIAALTDGSASHPGSLTYTPSRLADLRAQELTEAAKTLGVQPQQVFTFHRKDGALDAGDVALVDALADLVGIGGVRTIFAPWGGDSHPDHKAAFELSRLLASKTRTVLWVYPVWGLVQATDASANHADEPACRLDITAVRDVKRSAIACHRSQLGLVISDDPTGFVLSPSDVDLLSGRYEIFIGVA